MCACAYVRACAPEDGRNYRPKHVELIEIISKIITVASSWLFILLLKSYFHTVGTLRIVAVCECAHACVRACVRVLLRMGEIIARNMLS